MSNQNDTESLSPDEQMLVELLYNELEGEAAASARQTVASDEELASELADMRGVRALMAELPEEEPPAALSAQLLHAAAKRAPAARGASAVAPAEATGLFGWLKRFFQPIAMHPAMAAAATFVLVVGVAGALYVSGRVEVSEPRAPSATAEKKESAPAEKSAAPAASAELDQAGLPESHFDEDVVTEHEAAGDMSAPAGEASASGRGGGGMTGKSTGSKMSQPRRRATRKSASKADTAALEDYPSFGAAGSSSPGPTQSRELPAPDKVDKKKRAKKKMPAKQEPGQVLGGTVGGAVLGEGDARDQEKAKPLETDKDRERQQRLAEARRWHEKAVAAARDGECDAVIEIGQRVRKLDSRYYDTVYLRDQRLFECRHIKTPNAE